MIGCIGRVCKYFDAPSGSNACTLYIVRRTVHIDITQSERKRARRCYCVCVDARVFNMYEHKMRFVFAQISSTIWLVVSMRKQCMEKKNDTANDSNKFARWFQANPVANTFAERIEWHSQWHRKYVKLWRWENTILLSRYRSNRNDGRVLSLCTGTPEMGNTVRPSFTARKSCALRVSACEKFISNVNATFMHK